MMKIIINKLSEENWQDLLANSSNSSPFQTPKYYNFFNSIEGFSSDVFAVEAKGEYTSLMVVTIQKEKGIKSIFSKRGIVYGGPVFNSLTSLSLLLKEVKNYYSNNLIYIETRNFFDYSKANSVFMEHNFEYVPWLNFHLNTSNEDDMKKNISSSRLRQIKKSIKNGVIWKEASNLDEVNKFYEILHELYVKKIKKPLLPKSFFEEFYNQGIGKYLLIIFEGNVIGGIMCPVFSNKSIYEFYIAGKDKEYKNQYPSVMATWAAMEYANQNSIAIFDFMGAGSPSEDYGVRDFKSRFGGTEVEYGRFKLILDPIKYKLGVFGLKILSKI